MLYAKLKSSYSEVDDQWQEKENKDRANMEHSPSKGEPHAWTQATMFMPALNQQAPMSSSIIVRNWTIQKELD